MSHPSADPRVISRVAAEFGLILPEINDSRILEIACGEGHHILSVANLFPKASCVGIDSNAKAISRAKTRAKLANIPSVGFLPIALAEYQDAGEFDFIIVHGFFSWVSDEVRMNLMNFISIHLSTQGVAVVSFNVSAGWKERAIIIQKTRAIMSVSNCNEMEALQILMSVTDTDREIEIISDMLAKGLAVLVHDDFAPTMSAWSLGAFVKFCDLHSLQWLGDSRTGIRGNDAKDEWLKTSFRSELICRKDAYFSSPVKSIQNAVKTTCIPLFPKFDKWRMQSIREAIPVVDEDLNPCTFPFSQLKIMLTMDGTRSSYELSQIAKQQAPQLDFFPWLEHLAERGLFVKE